MIKDYGNEHDTARESLEEKYGQVWDTSELQKDFAVESFSAPYISVTKKETGEKGTLEFQHRPRFYFDFRVDNS